MYILRSLWYVHQHASVEFQFLIERNILESIEIANRTALPVRELSMQQNSRAWINIAPDTLSRLRVKELNSKTGEACFSLQLQARYSQQPAAAAAAVADDAAFDRQTSPVLAGACRQYGAFLSQRCALWKVWQYLHLPNLPNCLVIFLTYRTVVSAAIYSTTKCVWSA